MAQIVGCEMVAALVEIEEDAVAPAICWPLELRDYCPEKPALAGQVLRLEFAAFEPEASSS